MITVCNRIKRFLNRGTVFCIEYRTSYWIPMEESK